MAFVARQAGDVAALFFLARLAGTVDDEGYFEPWPGKAAWNVQEVRFSSPLPGERCAAERWRAALEMTPEHVEDWLSAWAAPLRPLWDVLTRTACRMTRALCIIALGVQHGLAIDMAGECRDFARVDWHFSRNEARQEFLSGRVDTESAAWDWRKAPGVGH